MMIEKSFLIEAKKSFGTNTEEEEIR